jgi:soluble lytic murein transglycosylase-like protein
MRQVRMPSAGRPWRLGQLPALITIAIVCVALLILLGLHTVEAATQGAAATQSKNAAATVTPAHPVQSVFDKEQAMTPAQLVQRWKSMVAKASRRFGVPVAWINAVMRVESGGRTMLSENTRMISDKGAMGIMQVMPQTYAQMREEYRLGSNPFDPQDNIQAGAAYLRWLKNTAIRQCLQLTMPAQSGLMVYWATASCYQKKLALMWPGSAIYWIAPAAATVHRLMPSA